MTAAVALAAALLAAAPAGDDAPASPSVESALEARALARVLAALPQRTVPATSPDLVRAARALAAAAASGDPHPLSASALRAALGAAGVHDPAPASVVLSAPPASLPDALAAAARFRGATHVGVGVVERGGIAWGVLLATERRAEIEPLPRRAAPGTTLLLRGRLVGLESPRAWVASPSGTVRELPLSVDGKGFSAPISLAAPGPWRIEVGGTGPRGATVAAILDVRCGDGPDVDAPATLPEPDPPGEGAAAARVRAEVDALRARHGLAPLRSSFALDAVARRHSEAMLETATLAHRVDGRGDLAARLAAAGLAFRSARENVARGDGALDAHRATVESPAHLASLLDPDVRLLGLGIARGVLPGGQPVTYLTEILLEPLGPFPAGDPPTGAR